jgi:hypothetical protein
MRQYGAFCSDYAAAAAGTRIFFLLAFLCSGSELVSARWIRLPRVLTAATRTESARGNNRRTLLNEDSPSSLALDVMSIKCGWNGKQSDQDENDAMACWVYTGRLHDPLTGQVLCSVEGVEIVQGLAAYHHHGDSSSSGNLDQHEGDRPCLSRFRRRCRTLQVASNLSPCTDCGAVLSRKVFCYTEPTNAVDGSLEDTAQSSSTRLLDKFRKRPNGPAKYIPLDQAVSVVDSVISTLSSTGTSDGTDARCTLLLHTECPRGKATWGLAHVPRTNRHDAVHEFSLHATSKAKPFQRSDIPIHAKNTDTATASAVASSPRRSAWIQFGASSAERNKASARETYVYRVDQDSQEPVLRYSRYGEAPVWYGPGRYCQLELTGQRLTRSSYLGHAVATRGTRDLVHNDWSEQLSRHVPVAAAVIQQHIPRFWHFGVSSQGRANTNMRVTEDATFTYYARALHAALEDSECSSDSSALHASTMTYSDFRRYYRDLAIGRAISRFERHSQVENLLSRDMSRESGRASKARCHLQTFCWKTQSCWEKLRAATSIEIGGSHDDWH